MIAISYPFKPQIIFGPFWSCTHHTPVNGNVYVYELHWGSAFEIVMAIFFFFLAPSIVLFDIFNAIAKCAHPRIKRSKEFD
ncbi:hypothetical protein THRCLA_20159 [Thraustotheca clavata]|uniref:Uncharacterized protein n=1 Tax=Thraustotheca clavata TaxID=74557 RepID=A0A1W0AAS9_9STRA|nr:hypothetical protein THRCLA_20159 [Thraustotheca clavata]